VAAWNYVWNIFFVALNKSEKKEDYLSDEQE
jgi:hypothetical protein